jgi:hypothetical protein
MKKVHNILYKMQYTVPRFPEVSASNNSCIYHGYLKAEPEVYVTMSGGCPYEKSFEVK